MSQERPFSHENANLPPYPYNVPGLSPEAFHWVQEQIRMYRQQEHLPSLTHALIHQWCWEARLTEHGTMPVDHNQREQRPRVEYVATPNGYLPKLVFPTEQKQAPVPYKVQGTYVPSPNGYVWQVTPPSGEEKQSIRYVPTPNGFIYKDTSNQERSDLLRRSGTENERSLSETMAAAGHAYYTLLKTALQHPDLTPEHLATVNDFGFALHQALLTSARTGDMASLSLHLLGQEHKDADIGDVISQALVVPGSPRLYVADNALPPSLHEQYYQQSIIPDVYIDTRRPSYAPDSFPRRTLAGYDRVPAQVRSYFTGNA